MHHYFAIDTNTTTNTNTTEVSVLLLLFAITTFSLSGPKTSFVVFKKNGKQKN